MNKIFKNSIFNIIQVVIVIPIFFILVPYTISKIGTEGYGIWALVGIIGSYQSFVDFGLTTGLIRFVAKAEAVKDYDGISEYLSTSAMIYLFFSLIIILIVILSKKIIVVNILGINNNLETAYFLVVFVALSSMVNMISGLFKSIIDGVQRMDISNGILTVQVLLSAIGTFYFLESGYDLKGLAINLLLCSSVSLIANVYFSKLILPYKIHPLLFKVSRFKEMFSYSINLQLSGLIRIWIEPLNKILISHFFSLSYVGYYEIALRFNKRITSLIRAALSPIFPAAAEIYQKHGFDKIEKLRIKSSKYLFTFLTPLYVLIIILIPDFVKLWLEPDMQIVSPLIVIFMVGLYVSLLATPAYTILKGLGYSRDTLFVGIQSVIVNIIGIFIFYKLMGFYGFCLGFSLSMAYSFFASQYYYKKRFGMELKVFKVFGDKKVIISSLIFLAIGIAFINIFSLNNYFKIAIFGLVFFIFNLIIIWKLRIITGADIELLIGNNLYNKILIKLQKLTVNINKNK